MTDDDALLGDCRRLLMSLTVQACPPDVARQRFQQFREEHADTDLTLIWEIEPADGSVSYDILIRETTGTTSLAVAPTEQLPWPLRGVTRSSEHDLLKLDGTRLTVAQGLAELDFVWSRTDLLTRLVDACVVAQELAERPIAVDGADVQACSEAYRRGKGLLTAEDTLTWLKQRGLTQARFTELMTRAATVRALRRRITGDLVTDWFDAHGASLDLLTVAWATRRGDVPPGSHVSDEEWTDGDDRDVLAAVADAVRQGHGGGVTRWREIDAPPELAGAQRGQTLDVTVDGGTAVARMLARDTARLDEATRQDVEKILFADWLTERRREADIEWFWGDSAGTSSAR